jgi:hypothetical protein
MYNWLMNGNFLTRKSKLKVIISQRIICLEYWSVSVSPVFCASRKLSQKSHSCHKWERMKSYYPQYMCTILYLNVGKRETGRKSQSWKCVTSVAYTRSWISYTCMNKYLLWWFFREFIGWLRAGIATGYGLDDQGVGVRAPVGAKIFCSCRRDRF